MSEITLEFFYTAQSVLTTPGVDCYQVMPGACPNPNMLTSSSSPVLVVFRPYTPATATADSYMLVAFTGITIPAGGSLLVRLGLHNTTSTSTSKFDMTKDYSYTAADTAFTDAPNIPLYYNGILLWGTPPS
jgi:hypothetical protein